MGESSLGKVARSRPSRPCFVNSNVAARITRRWACAHEAPAWPTATLCGSRPRAPPERRRFPLRPSESLGVQSGEERAPRLLPPRPGAETSTRLRRLLQPRRRAARVPGTKRGQRGQQARASRRRGASGAVGGTGPRGAQTGSEASGAGMPPPLEGRSGGPRRRPWRCPAVEPAGSPAAEPRCRGRVRKGRWSGSAEAAARSEGHLGRPVRRESTVNRPTLWPTGSPGVAVSANRGPLCRDMGPTGTWGLAGSS